jgi:hypothetical protein
LDAVLLEIVVMISKFEATYDGTVLRPLGPLAIAPNTKVVVTVELPPAKEETPRKSFLETAREMKLTGLPPDLSTNLDYYLYGTEPDHGS